MMFWVGNEELSHIYAKRLRDVDYLSCKFGRTNNLSLLTALPKDYCRVVNLRGVIFNNCSDRVLQLLHVEYRDVIQNQQRQNPPSLPPGLGRAKIISKLILLWKPLQIDIEILDHHITTGRPVFAILEWIQSFAECRHTCHQTLPLWE
ncbi:hypothetical protein YC2023_005915 [Brassica napus]